MGFLHRGDGDPQSDTSSPTTVELTERAHERLEDLSGAGAIFTSGLSVNEFALLRGLGPTPMAQVMGASVVRTGWQYLPRSQPGPAAYVTPRLWPHADASAGSLGQRVRRDLRISDPQLSVGDPGRLPAGHDQRRLEPGTTARAGAIDRRGDRGRRRRGRRRLAAARPTTTSDGAPSSTPSTERRSARATPRAAHRRAGADRPVGPGVHEADSSRPGAGRPGGDDRRGVRVAVA